MFICRPTIFLQTGPDAGNESKNALVPDRQIDALSLRANLAHLGRERQFSRGATLFKPLSTYTQKTKKRL
jgi:hypothetical protein